ncbi:MAG TPA: class I SAM-dependent methyltransferase [Vicinamibacterales bacterium]|nr:class I SAM-dependent methyltransferase [Vicinamibacterales bacterium]
MSDLSKFLTFAPPGHYYSPLPDYAQVQARYQQFVPTPTGGLPGIDLNEPGQLALLEELAAFAPDLPYTDQAGGVTRYYYENAFFPRGDGIVATCLLRHSGSRRVIEIGSGYSSALMLDVKERFAPDLELICVEPDATRLRSLLRPGDANRFRLVEDTLDAVDDALFDTLRANDVLFIDSSHVAKIGSDVSRIVFRILPRLAVGVLVHIHDIFWPFEYPRQWYAEGRAWNEAPFVRSFLMFNRAFQIVYFNHYMAAVHADDVAKRLPDCLRQPGGSLWIRRVAAD